MHTNEFKKKLSHRAVVIKTQIISLKCHKTQQNRSDIKSYQLSVTGLCLVRSELLQTFWRETTHSTASARQTRLSYYLSEQNSKAQSTNGGRASCHRLNQSGWLLRRGSTFVQRLLMASLK